MTFFDSLYCVILGAGIICQSSVRSTAVCSVRADVKVGGLLPAAMCSKRNFKNFVFFRKNGQKKHDTKPESGKF